MSRKKKARPQGVIVNGVYSSAQGGFGFVHPENGGSDIFVPPPGVSGALDGDTVELETFYPDKAGFVLDRPAKGPVGFIRSILKRGRTFVVARMESAHTARPLDKHLPDEIPVNSVPRGTKSGDWVKLRLLKDGSKHTEKLRGGVEERIGRAGTVSGDLDAIMAEFRLEAPYTKQEENAAMQLEPADITREDLRELYTVTIDPSDAHDFDDAVSVNASGPDEIQIGVHIADAAAWIRPGSVFDKKAEKRTFSSYLPGRFLPMLPKKLTEKISLREGSDSIAHSILFKIRRSDGTILSTRRIHSTVRIDKRLTYREVQSFLDGETPENWDRELILHTKLLALIAGRLRARRKRTEQFLDMIIPETRVICSEETGTVSAIEHRTESEADQLVEEYMLAANSAVAAELLAGHLPGLFRIHPEPVPEKIEDFCAFTEQVFQFRPGDILSSRTACTKFLASIPDDHRKPILLSAFLRALPRASYAAESGLHFGLGKVEYSHFTSPIRRYTDLLIHQQLWGMDTNTKFKSKKKMDELAVYCSGQEERNDNAYFAASDRLKLHFLKQHHALDDRKLYEAVIAKVSANGLVCDIQELGIYGFVPASMMHGRKLRKAGGKVRNSSSHTEYKPGDFVYLVLDSLDLVRGHAVFRPAL